MKVYIFLADGFEEIEAITVIDVLRRAGVDIRTVSITGKNEVIGSHEIKVTADLLFDESLLKDGEMIVLPGGMPGTANLSKHDGLSGLIRYYSENDKWIAAICAAPMVYGRMGLLKGKCATCYPGFEKDLAGAELKVDKVVVDGKCVTSRGPGTAIYFALKLVEVLKDSQTADKLKKGMLVE